MSTSAVRAGTEDPAAPVRARIAAAGRELFSRDGYERTTVEAIAERAGVGRRTFFRHFRGKDDVIFIDHDRIAARVEAHLATVGHLSPLEAICGGVRLVSRSYVDDPDTSVQCYALIRSVPALRDREIAWVSVYTRMFARYLRVRLGGTAQALLVADVAAAAVVAAHNHVLRDWLQRGGVGDLSAELDRALAWVRVRLEQSDLPTGVPAGEESAQAAVAGSGPAPGDVVVAVFRADDPLDDVVERISRSL